MADLDQYHPDGLAVYCTNCGRVLILDYAWITAYGVLLSRGNRISSTLYGRISSTLYGQGQPACCGTTYGKRVDTPGMASSRECRGQMVRHENSDVLIAAYKLGGVSAAEDILRHT